MSGVGQCSDAESSAGVNMVGRRPTLRKLLYCQSSLVTTLLYVAFGLTPPEFFLRQILKKNVYSNNTQSLEELKHNIEHNVAKTCPETLHIASTKHTKEMDDVCLPESKWLFKVPYIKLFCKLYPINKKLRTIHLPGYIDATEADYCKSLAFMYKPRGLSRIVHLYCK
jgi:hypothetical protein